MAPPGRREKSYIKFLRERGVATDAAVPRDLFRPEVAVWAVHAAADMVIKAIEDFGPAAPRLTFVLAAMIQVYTGPDAPKM